MRQLGGAFGVAVLVAVFGRTGSYASAQAFTDGFAPAIGACAALSLSGRSHRPLRAQPAHRNQGRAHKGAPAN